MRTTQAVLALFFCLTVGCSAGRRENCSAERKEKIDVKPHLQTQQVSIDPQSQTLMRRVVRNADSQEQGFHDAQADDALALLAALDHALDAERLAQFASEQRATYAGAKPFPHLFIDGLLPSEVLRAVNKEFPPIDEETGCMVGNSACFKAPRENGKSGFENESKMGRITQAAFKKLKSPGFLRFLSSLTGINNLIADPHFFGSGLHHTPPGGSLDVHADFNRRNFGNHTGQWQLERRVNMFLFLNEDPWPESYGGHLQMWSKDMTHCSQRILPKFGRFVVFSSTDFSYHGHPDPLTAPAGRGRRSMALYFYTDPAVKRRSKEECLNHDCTGSEHSTLWQQPVGCSQCTESSCAMFPSS
mmetsp:Transcript_47168/g.93855  ORF Transcript_47168/g.93855 Transcript_47168/m.93855 type:complete len:359 (-) Transcript_47168:98-1174(-)